MNGWTLAIDTATGVNVGLARDGQPVASMTDPSSRSHVERLQPMVDQLLAESGIGPADLALIAVGVGPGPFTGLRVGIIAARILGLVAAVPVRGFGTLDAIALGWFARAATSPGAAPGGEELLVVTDARRKEVYWAGYDSGGRRVRGPLVDAPAELPALPVIGPGTQVYPELFAERVPADAGSGPDAALVAARIAELPDTGLEPAYLRKPDAAVPKTRKSALAGGRLRLPAGLEADR